MSKDLVVEIVLKSGKSFTVTNLGGYNDFRSFANAAKIGSTEGSLVFEELAIPTRAIDYIQEVKVKVN